MNEEQENQNIINDTEETIKEQVEVVKEGFTEMYGKAMQDVNSMGPLGRIFIAGIIIIAIFKLTPILDLLYYAFQIVVIPTLFMVAWGVISNETYNMGIGYIDDLINHLRKKREANNNQVKKEA